MYSIPVPSIQKKINVFLANATITTTGRHLKTEKETGRLSGVVYSTMDKAYLDGLNKNILENRKEPTLGRRNVSHGKFCSHTRVRAYLDILIIVLTTKHCKYNFLYSI